MMLLALRSSDHEKNDNRSPVLVAEIYDCAESANFGRIAEENLTLN